MFNFIWKTPHACKSEHVTGDDCKVEDPVSGRQIDFNVLRKKSLNVDYSIDDENVRYSLNICGPLKEEDCGFKDAGACKFRLKKDLSIDQPEVIGVYSKKVYYKDGMAYIKLEGSETCKSDKDQKKRTVITLMCGDKGTSSPEFDRIEGKCTYHFTWKSSLLCDPEAEEVECVLHTAKGNSFDLSRLSSEKGSLAKSASPKTQFYVNVCKGISRSECPPNAGACEYDREKDKYISLGRVTNGLEYENESLSITYTDGDDCPNKKDKRSRQRLNLFVMMKVS